MSSGGVDTGRRRFLTGAVTVVGGVGAVGAAIPFASAWQPSERAKAIGAPVEIDISKIQPGMMITEEWQGKPVWVLRRTPDALESIKALDDAVGDPNSENEDMQPEYARNQHRARKEEFLVLIGLCTHLGCSPKHVKAEDGLNQGLGDDWKGGFFCPCHGSRFDLAGRVYKNVPAPDNLPVPKHKYLSDTVILVGEDEGSA